MAKPSKRLPARRARPSDPQHTDLPKAPTGISGLDEITYGGLPKGRPTLVCGSAGSGKTMLAMEFLVRGARQFNEPGVFMTFEERAEDLQANFASMGFDLDGLAAHKKLVLDYIYVERSEIEETGEYDLEGLFVRLDHAVKSVGAKRVVLDTIETLFSGLSNQGILRAELRRLFRWLKDQGLTAVVTGESGGAAGGALTRYGLEEYIADCVISIDHRVTDQIATRRMRIVKYRGSRHGTNEYPFLLSEKGVSVLPITSLGLNYAVSTARVSTGVERLDEMFGGKGFFRGSSILVSGTPGTGKTTLAAQFVDAACRRGDRCLYIASEESPAQIVRNMRSVGMDLDAWVRKGLLRFHAGRPTLYGLESHLLNAHRLIEEFEPRIIVMDPVSNLISQGTTGEVKAMMTRIIDFMKASQITAFFTDLTSGGRIAESTAAEISSLMDTWIVLGNLENAGERNRTLGIVKSRGMAHSDQMREFRLTSKGITLQDVYVGPQGILTGTARALQEAKEKAEAATRRRETEKRKREMVRKRRVTEAQIAVLKTECEAAEDELTSLASLDRQREETLVEGRSQMARIRSRGAKR